MTSNTRYDVGDTVVLDKQVANGEREGYGKFEVVDIINADSESPDYQVELIGGEGYNDSVWLKASDIRKHQEGNDWKAKAKKELEEKLDVQTERKGNYHLQVQNAGKDGFSLLAIKGEGSNGEREWMVFKDHQAAREAAVEEARRMLDEMPQSFNDSFIQNYLYITDTDQRMIARDDAEHRVRAELDSMSREEVRRKARDKGITAPSHYDDQDQEYNYMKDELMEKMEMDIADRIEEQLDNPIQYFVDDHGMYSKETLMEQSFIRIDKEEAAEDAVATDGVGHFLDHYDGKAVNLESGAVAYGAN